MNPEKNSLDEAFDQTKKKFTQAFRHIVQPEKVDSVLAEAAFPAYAHRNWLINRIMWQRLRVVFDYCNQRPGSRILDFGCGSGVAAYLLAQAGHAVTLFDTEYRPLRLMQAQLAFPPLPTLQPENLTPSTLKHSFDFIIVLDVLEHIRGLSNQVMLFRELLTSTGELIVSGPTENSLYPIGRRLAGRAFSGTYHVSNIRLIKRELTKSGDITDLATIYPLLPLFEVFTLKVS